ncbi:MAG: hypothetical protein WBG95_01995 [Sulfitobacter sp.]
MSQDLFNARIARINNHSGFGNGKLGTGEGVATSMYSSPRVADEKKSVRRNFKPMIMGAVLGMIAGAVAAGLENPSMPWGPGFEYNAMITLPAIVALVAGPVMAIAASAMRARFPSFFFFAAAYFPCVVATALVDLPLF